MPAKLLLTVFALAVVPLSAQQASDSQVLAQVLQRLDSLEKQNRQLLEEVRALREQVQNSDRAASPQAAAETQTASLEDRVAVAEDRISEQAQTKVEASQKFPISLTGTLLFNAFLNSGANANYSADAYGLLSGPERAGATVRQTLLGLNFEGPQLPGDGQVRGSLMMDFGSGYAQPGASWIRLRRGNISLDWKNRSFLVGQEKPLISPYQPDSLAEVIIPPLSGAGNLWLWLPQARYEERVHFGQTNGLTGQIALLQTDEKYQNVPDEYADTVAAARPALQGRFAYWHAFDDTHRIEVAPGFHVSTSHVAGYSVDSRLASLDWKATPWWKLEFTGTAFHGRNAAGLGALGNGFSILPNGDITAVRSTGGWTQLSLPVTSRLKWNVFGGVENDAAASLPANAIVHNFTYASNLMYRIGPNVIVSFEALQMRSRLFSGDFQKRNHYDLALGYLF
ncbi:MAG TPA: hypothetical protein VH477_19310 [Bryobacteraceae bacterium]